MLFCVTRGLTRIKKKRREGGTFKKVPGFICAKGEFVVGVVVVIRRGVFCVGVI